MKANTLWLLLPLLVTFLFSVITTPATATTPASPPPAGKISSESNGGQKVNINNADVATLCTLKGIGPQLAQRIKEFREQHGPFKQVEDLTEVRGVGETILEWNKNLIEIK